MAYTVLQSYAYDNVLVIEYFCATTNFDIRMYARTVIVDPACHTPAIVFFFRKIAKSRQLFP